MPTHWHLKIGTTLQVHRGELPELLSLGKTKMVVVESLFPKDTDLIKNRMAGNIKFPNHININM